MTKIIQKAKYTRKPANNNNDNRPKTELPNYRVSREERRANGMEVGWGRGLRGDKLNVVPYELNYPFELCCVS